VIQLVSSCESCSPSLERNPANLIEDQTSTKERIAIRHKSHVALRLVPNVVDWCFTQGLILLLVAPLLVRKQQEFSVIFSDLVRLLI
jgi:hypothetical protein